MALLAVTLLAASVSAAPTGADLAREIIYAPTNAGLKPQRLQTFGRTHYFQLADNPRGTLVGGTHGIQHHMLQALLRPHAPASPNLAFSTILSSVAQRRSELTTYWGLSWVCCPGHLSWLRPSSEGILPLRPRQLCRMPR